MEGSFLVWIFTVSEDLAVLLADFKEVETGIEIIEDCGIIMRRNMKGLGHEFLSVIKTRFAFFAFKNFQKLSIKIT